MSETTQDVASRLTQLDLLYVEAIAAFAPPNPQFERDRIITSLTNKRELAYVLGFLSEGENEAALIIELARDMLAGDALADIDHLVDEAWYYLRTSIDPTWQLDPVVRQASTALDYLIAVIRRRIDRTSTVSFGTALAEFVEDDARTLLTGHVR